jgi:hypothetical protein
MLFLQLVAFRCQPVRQSNRYSGIGYAVIDSGQKFVFENVGGELLKQESLDSPGFVKYCHLEQSQPIPGGLPVEYSLNIKLVAWKSHS